jgi:hypothetical protein
LTSDVLNYRGKPVTGRYYRKTFDTNNLPNFYFGAAYFKKNDFAKEYFNWVEDILSTSPLTFGGKEIMIDVSDLNYNEKVKLFDILFPHIDRDLDGANGDGDWGWDCLIKNKNVKSISLHCGIEDNEYEPQKGRVCCLSYVFGDEKEQNPESIVPVRGKDLLGLDINQQTSMNESEEEEFNWAEDIIANTTEEIDTFFIVMRENQTNLVEQENDIIYVKGKEHVLNVLYKTIIALEYLFQKNEYDFVMPDSMFFDSFFHLNYRGRDIRTNKIISLYNQNKI